MALLPREQRDTTTGCTSNSRGGAIDNYSNGEDDQWSQWQRSRLDPSFVYIEYNILSLSNITNYIMLFSDHKFVFQTLSQNCAEGGSGRRLGSGTLRKIHIIVYCPTCSETIVIGPVPGVSVHVPNASCVKCPTTHNLFSNTLYHLH